MDTIKSCIAKISEQAKDYKKYSNQWNVAQQLIDIVAINEKSAEMVFEDLNIEEMNVDSIVKRITGKKLADPNKVMEALCDFYKIDVPAELPAEYWRTQGQCVKPAKKKSLLDLI